MVDFASLPHPHFIAKLHLWVRAYNHQEKRVARKLEKFVISKGTITKMSCSTAQAFLKRLYFWTYEVNVTH